MRRLLALALLAALLTTPTALGQAWSQENAGPLNEGTLDRSAPASLENPARTSTGAKVLTQVTEGPAGFALVGTLDGRVLALDASHRTVWSFDVSDPIRTAPVWTGTHVIVLPRSDEAVALNPDGSEAWTFPVENVRSNAALVRMASPAVHPSGDVLLATMAGTVHRVAPNGSSVWSYDIGGDQAIEATPAITPNGDVIVAGFVPGQEGQGTLARIDGATGTTDCSDCWTREIGSQVVGAPTVLDTTFLLPLRDGDALQARSLQDGSLEWSVGFDDHLTMSPAVRAGITVAGDIRGVLRGIDTASGEILWSFNPLSGDPNIDHTEPCTALTVADSPAIDQQGHAWVAYWNAYICGGFPPTESRSSPFYLLDSETGEILDRTRFPKAAHGPSLHATGVWTGSDEQGVRHWSRGSLLTLDAYAPSQEVTLLTNTDRTGEWTITWPDGTEATGQGHPPAMVKRTLAEGQHQIHVTVGDAQASVPVTVQTTRGQDGEATHTDANDAPPLAPGLTLLALLGAAWRRQRG